MLFYSLEDLRDYEKSGYDECIAARITDKVKCALADTKHLRKSLTAGMNAVKADIAGLRGLQ